MRMGEENSGKERKLEEVIAYRREIEAQVRRLLNHFKRAHAANSWLAGAAAAYSFLYILLYKMLTGDFHAKPNNKTSHQNRCREVPN